MNDMDLQLNQSQCIASFYRLFEYEYHNVCTGKVVFIPWGFTEYLGFLILCALSLAALSFLAFVTGIDYYVWRFFRGRK